MDHEGFSNAFGTPTDARATPSTSSPRPRHGVATSALHQCSPRAQHHGANHPPARARDESPDANDGAPPPAAARPDLPSADPSSPPPRCAQLILAYPAWFRTWARVTFPDNLDALELWEKQCGISCAVILLVRGLRAESLDQFVSTVFFYCKAVGAPLAYFADPLDPHGPGARCVAVYLALLLILHLFVGHPTHDWLPSKVVALTPRTFEDDVMSDKESKESAKASGKWKKVEWLVLFYANHDARSSHVAPTFAKISREFATDGLRFAKLDVARWPATAKRMNIDVEAIGRDAVVPTIMLISGGEERLRLPEVYDDGTRVKFPVQRARRVDIVKGFGLEERHAKTRPKDQDAKKRD